MFQHFNESAGRVIFYARQEAGRSGSRKIRTGHLRAGLFCEIPGLCERAGVSYKALSRKGSPLPDSLDLPLSRAAKRVLGYGQEEAERAQAGVVGPEHLLLGLIREENGAIAEAREALLHMQPAAPLADWAEALRDLGLLIEDATRKLREMGEPEVDGPVREGGWSRKQILGHLIDSAANNHQRFVRTQLEPLYHSPGYDQEEWVLTQGYQLESWTPLVDLWTAYNRHLLHVAGSTPPPMRGRFLKIADGKPQALGSVVASYVEHCKHHLSQIGIHV
jgi:hypothetical protein